MKCIKCGGDMVGDGYTVPIHCEYVVEPEIDIVEPDSGPWYCDFVEPYNPVERYKKLGLAYELVIAAWAGNIPYNVYVQTLRNAEDYDINFDVPVTCGHFDHIWDECESSLQRKFS